MNQRSSSSIYRAIAHRLRQARCNAGYRSARSFARAHAISVTTYNNHEICKRGLSIHTALYYSNLLGISACWLITSKAH